MGLAATYQPRHPDQSLLYQVIAEHLETFLARQQERDSGRFPARSLSGRLDERTCDGSRRSERG